MDSMKYGTQSTLVTADKISKHIADPKFKEIRQVTDSVFCVVKHKKKVQLNSPIFLGCIILQRAKLVNYKFILMNALPYGSSYPESQIRCDSVQDRISIEISRRFLHKVTLLYCDTDSYYLEIKAKTKGLTADFIFKHLFPNQLIDRSNFKILDKHYNNNEHGSLGYFKSEVGDDIISESVFIAPKCYSIESVKRTPEITRPCHVTDQALELIKIEASRRVYAQWHGRIQTLQTFSE